MHRGTEDTPVVAISVSDGELRRALASVFQQTEWAVSLLESADSAAGIKHVHRQQGRVDAWIYAPPPLDGTVSGSSLSDAIAVLEAGSAAVREIVGLQAHGAAVVVYVSVEAVSVGTQSPSYASLHAALLASVRALGVAWAQQSVRVNAILAPLGSAFARVHPTRFPIRRPAKPEDLAWPAVFLASPEASYVTAEALRVDGGFLCYQYF